MEEIYLLYTVSSEDCIFYGTPRLIKAYKNKDEAETELVNFNRKNNPYARAYLEKTILV